MALAVSTNSETYGEVLGQVITLTSGGTGDSGQPLRQAVVSVCLTPADTLDTKAWAASCWQGSAPPVLSHIVPERTQFRPHSPSGSDKGKPVLALAGTLLRVPLPSADFICPFTVPHCGRERDGSAKIWEASLHPRVV